MYNQAIFNQGSFNQPSDDYIVQLQTEAYETISGLFGVAVSAYLDTNANESILTVCTANAGVMLSNDTDESIGAECAAIGVVSMLNNSSEKVGCKCILGANIHLLNNAVEEAQCKCILGAIAFLAMEAKEDVSTGKLILGCIAKIPGQSIYEIVTAQCGIEATEIVELQIDVSLAPGQTLVIDSDNCVVLLDGENIVAKHEGGWPWLERLTRLIQIETGTPATGLQSSLLYTERWL